jgi:hypothetical protein
MKEGVVNLNPAYQRDSVVSYLKLSRIESRFLRPLLTTAFLFPLVSVVDVQI